MNKFSPSFFGWKSQGCCCYISTFKLLTLSLTHANGHCPNSPIMVLGITRSRDVPNKQHGQGHLVGIEFTTMDLQSLGLKAGDQAMACFISWHRQNSSPLVSWCLGQTKLGSPPNSSSLPPLPDHRGCLTGSTCCSGVELPAPQVGLGTACFPFLAAKVHGQHHNFSHLADATPLEDQEVTPGPLLFAGGAGTLLLTPARHSWESCLSPQNPHEMPFLPGTKPLSDPKPASPPMDAPWIPRSWSRQQSSTPTWSSRWALQPVVGLQCRV